MKNTAPMITVHELSKAFPGTPVLNQVSMTVYKGEIYGFLGENGAGKTTLMKILLNLLKADSGEVTIAGHAVLPGSFQYLSGIGSIIEYPVFYEELTARQNLRLHCQYLNIDTQNIESVLQLTGLTQAQGKPVKDFSLGMKQRLGLARAIISKPRLLILDEPVNGLDPTGIRDIRQLLLKLKKEWQTTILISSHIVSEIESIADRIGILHNGCLLTEVTNGSWSQDSLEDFFIQTINGGITHA